MVLSNSKEKEPSITESVKKLAALVKMNLGIKETAQILGINDSSVKIARTRLKKKLGAESSDSLNQLISEI